MNFHRLLAPAFATLLFQACPHATPPEPDGGEPDSGVLPCAGRPCNEGWSLVTEPFAAEVTDIATTGPDNVWVLGTGPNAVEYAARWDGKTWTTYPIQTGPTGAISTDAIWTSGQSIAFVAGRSVESDYYTPRTWRFNAGSWESIPTSGPTGTPLLDLWGSSPTDLWTVGYNHFLHGDGTSWTEVTAPLPAKYEMRAIRGTAPDNVWAAGMSNTGSLIVLRLNGGAWEDVTPAVTGFNRPLGFWVAGPDEAWVAIQSSTAVWHRQAGAWTSIDVNGGAYAVWGSAPNDVWFAGSGGLSHWNGQAMSQVDPGLDAGTLWGLSGSGPNDVWAWGQQTLHFHR